MKIEMVLVCLGLGVSASADPLPPAFRPAWVKSFGGIHDQFVTDVAASDGKIFVVGWAEDQIGFPGGPTTPFGGPFLAALDANGDLLFGKAYSKAGASFSTVVPTPDGNVVVTGMDSGGDLGCGPKRLSFQAGFFAKLDGATGGCLWQRRWTSTIGHTIDAVKTLPGGDLMVVGTFRGTLDFKNGRTIENDNLRYQPFVTRTDPKGVPRWVEVFGNTEPGDGGIVRAIDVATDSNGTTFIVGDLQGKVDLAGEQLAIERSDADNYVVALDGNGARLWSYVQPSEPYPFTVVDVRAGRVAVSGGVSHDFVFAGQTVAASPGSRAVFDFGVDGHQRWAQVFDSSFAVAVDDADRVIVAGYDLETVHLGDLVVPPRTYLLAVLDGNTGDPVRASTIENANADSDQSSFIQLRMGVNGLPILSGTFSGSLPGGTTANEADGFVMALVK